MANAEEYLDLNDIKTIAEELPEGVEIESSDYDEGGIMLPGEYTSPSRKIEAKAPNAEGHITFKITFDSGVTNGTGQVFMTRFPLRKWITTKTWREDDKPGATSQVAQYLRRVGVDPKGLTLAETVEAMIESQNVPVGVYVGYKSRAKKVPNGDGFTYVDDHKLKTKDFLVGTKDDGHYVSQVERNGETVYAQPNVTSFFEVQ